MILTVGKHVALGHFHCYTVDQQHYLESSPIGLHVETVRRWEKDSELGTRWSREFFHESISWPEGRDPSRCVWFGSRRHVDTLGEENLYRSDVVSVCRIRLSRTPSPSHRERRVEVGVGEAMSQKISR